MFGIQHSFTPLYHPQANPVERTNRVIKTIIRSFIRDNHPDWDVYIHDFRFAYNTGFHTTINATPAFLNMGREPRPRKSFRRLGERGNELPPVDAGYWAARMSKLSQLVR